MRGTIDNHHALCRCPSADCGWLGTVGESDAMDLSDLSSQTSVCPRCAREVELVTADELRRELELLAKASYWKCAGLDETGRTAGAHRASTFRVIAVLKCAASVTTTRQGQ